MDELIAFAVGFVLGAAQLKWWPLPWTWLWAKFRALIGH